MLFLSIGVNPKNKGQTFRKVGRKATGLRLRISKEPAEKKNEGRRNFSGSNIERHINDITTKSIMGKNMKKLVLLALALSMLVAINECTEAEESISPKERTSFGEVKMVPEALEPSDAEQRRSAKSVVCYKGENLPRPQMDLYTKARNDMKKIKTIVVPPRDARTFSVKAGQFFRIVSVDGPQVGDMNLWNAHDLNERFFSGKTRQLHATHLSTGDRLWTNLPYLRPMATITFDTLSWYGYDDEGAGVHDVIGTRCDPYTNRLLNNVDYNNTCHSNLVRALAKERNMTPEQAEPYVHDVLNVFMCTGFTKDTHKYFMKASPVRPDDYLEFFAEIDLLGVISACPGGDCGASHSDSSVPCYPLLVEIFQPSEKYNKDILDNWHSPDVSKYKGEHGIKSQIK